MRKLIPMENSTLKDLTSLIAGAIVRVHSASPENSQRKAKITGPQLAIDVIPGQYKHSPYGGETNNGTPGKRKKKTEFRTVCP